MKTDQILQKYHIISDQVELTELRVLLYQLEAQLRRGLSGNVVEFGCYVGTTSLFIRRLLDSYQFAGAFHAYDSFAGLPEKSVQDKSVVGEQFVAGELRASRKTLLQNFKKAGLRPPIIHKGWFGEFAPADIPDQIIFAFLDGDYYTSIKDSFAQITPKLAPRAVVVVDDYVSEALPGAAKATNEWCHAHDLTPQVQASLAIIQT